MTPKQIKAIRRALGVTQQEIAQMIGATQVTIARYETGVSQPTGAYRLALEELAAKVKGKKANKKGGRLWIKSRE